jgi:hypothetical protein
MFFRTATLTAWILSVAFADGAVLPDPVDVLNRAIERARKQADDPGATVYLFDKRTTIDTLDPKGKVTKQKVKLFEVTMTGGVPIERLVALEGKKLSKTAIAKEEEKSSRWRRGFARSEGESKRQSFIPADMSGKYDLAFVRVENIGNRRAWVLSFAPKTPALAAKTFADRIVNRLSGLIWIDAQDSEIARISVKLDKKVNLWAGLLGALYKVDFKLDRKRSSEGVWYNDFADIRFDARGLLKRLRMKIVEQSSNFRPVLKPAPESARQP